MAIRLVDGVLQINEDEAPAIRTIFEQYVNTDTGANGLSKYLETHGFQKLARQNGTSPLFSATLIRAILKNPVYCGKIAFGRRKLEKIHGTRNEYHLFIKLGQFVALLSNEVLQLPDALHLDGLSGIIGIGLLL